MRYLSLFNFAATSKPRTRTKNSAVLWMSPVGSCGIAGENSKLSITNYAAILIAAKLSSAKCQVVAASTRFPVFGGRAPERVFQHLEKAVQRFQIRVLHGSGESFFHFVISRNHGGITFPHQLARR